MKIRSAHPSRSAWLHHVECAQVISPGEEAAACEDRGKPCAASLADRQDSIRSCSNNLTRTFDFGFRRGAAKLSGHACNTHRLSSILSRSFHFVAEKLI